MLILKDFETDLDKLYDSKNYECRWRIPWLIIPWAIGVNVSIIIPKYKEKVSKILGLSKEVWEIDNFWLRLNFEKETEITLMNDDNIDQRIIELLEMFEVVIMDNVKLENNAINNLKYKTQSMSEFKNMYWHTEYPRMDGEYWVIYKDIKDSVRWNNITTSFTPTHIIKDEIVMNFKELWIEKSFPNTRKDIWNYLQQVFATSWYNYYIKWDDRRIWEMMNIAAMKLDALMINHKFNTKKWQLIFFNDKNIVHGRRCKSFEYMADIRYLSWFM